MTDMLDLRHMPLAGVHVSDDDDQTRPYIVLMFEVSDPDPAVMDSLVDMAQDWSGYDHHDHHDDMLYVYCKTVHAPLAMQYRTVLHYDVVQTLRYAMWSDDYGLRLTTGPTNVHTLVKALSWAGSLSLVVHASLAPIGSHFDVDD